MQSVCDGSSKMARSGAPVGTCYMYDVPPSLSSRRRPWSRCAQSRGVKGTLRLMWHQGDLVGGRSRLCFWTDGLGQAAELGFGRVIQRGGKRQVVVRPEPAATDVVSAKGFARLASSVRVACREPNDLVVGGVCHGKSS
nr:hypothetical protein CFP56_16922 [Quercus suber]